MRYFPEFGLGVVARRAVRSANSRLISVTSCSSFLGSRSTDACLQRSVHSSSSFMSTLMRFSFLAYP